MDRTLSVVEFTLLHKILISVIPILFAITVHEVAHGWVAMRLGDRTAQMMGRLTLNPIKHIDPIGTILVPGMLLTAFGIMFGWAKAVPVTFQNLRNPKSDMAWVALAGPLANLFMAIIWGAITKLGVILYKSDIALGEPMFYMGIVGVLSNAMLMILNLLPLPPLDGGRILVSLLPGPLSWKVSRLEPYGFYILLALIYFGGLIKVLWVLVLLFSTLVEASFYLPADFFAIYSNRLFR
jgi:Zn-dependent protease